MPCHPVLDRAHPAGVRRDVAAERRAVLARTHRIHETVRREGHVQLLQADARLHHGDVIVGVDFNDRIHPFQRQNNAVRTGDTGAGQARSGAACGHGDAKFVATTHDRGHFVGRTRAHDRQRPYRCGRQRFVVRVIVADIGADAEVSRSDGRDELRFEITHKGCVYAATRLGSSRDALIDALPVPRLHRVCAVRDRNLA